MSNSNIAGHRPGHPSRVSRRSAVALLLAALGALGCAAAPDVRGDLILSPELLPTPYSAAELREGNPPGTTRTYIVTNGDAVVLQRTSFVEHPEGLARFRQERFDLDGAPLGDAAVGDARWEELQAHASYPRAEATRRDAACVTAAGRFDAWLYDWREPARDEQPAAHHRVWFAKDLPGPPVLYEMTVGGALAFRMELVEAP